MVGGGLQNGKVGHVKFYPYENGEAERLNSHAEGEGDAKRFGVVLCGSLQF